MKYHNSLLRRVSVTVFTMFFLLTLLLVFIQMALEGRGDYVEGKIQETVEREEQVRLLQQRFLRFGFEVRGYLAYGQEELIESQRAAAHSFEKELWKLRRQLSEAEEKNLREVLDGVESAWNDFRRSTDMAIEHKQAGRTAELAKLVQGVSSPRWEAVLTGLDELVTRIKDQRSAWIAEGNRAESWRGVLVPVALLATLAAAFGMLANLRRTVIQPILEAQRAVEESARGAFLRVVDDGREDEIGQLARGVNRMVDELEGRSREGERCHGEMAQARERLATQGALLDGILAGTREGMMFVDGQGRVVFCNKAMAEFLGSTPAAVKKAEDLVSLAPGLGEKLFRFGQALAADGGQGRTETLGLADSSGGQRRFDAYGVGLNGGYLLLLREQSQEEQGEDLAKEFVDCLAHELRAPLASILSFVEIMEHRAPTPKKQAEYLATIHREGERIAQLVDDFVDLHRMEGGAFPFVMEEVDVGALLEETVALYQGRDGHRIDLQLPTTPVLLLGDKKRLGQLFANLLSNAIKYSPGRDHVEVTARKAGDWLRVEFRDFGLGIGEEHRSRLFQKYYRIDQAERRKIGGSGLGLAICKQIAEAHGGEVGYHSKGGYGSEFFVRLPIAPQAG